MSNLQFLLDKDLISCEGYNEQWEVYIKEAVKNITSLNFSSAADQFLIHYCKQPNTLLTQLLIT